MSQATALRERLQARMLEAQAQFETMHATSKKVVKGFAEQMLKGKPPSFAALWGFHAGASDACSKIERTLADIQRDTDLLDAKEREVETAALKALVSGTADAIAAASIATGVSLNDEKFVRAVLQTIGTDQEKLITAAFDELAVRAEASSIQAKMIEAIARRYSEIKETA